MSESGLDVGERHPAGDQPRDVGVSQVVEPEGGNAPFAEVGHQPGDLTRLKGRLRAPRRVEIGWFERALALVRRALRPVGPPPGGTT